MTNPSLNQNERIVWDARPSQWITITSHVTLAFGLLVLLAGIIALLIFQSDFISIVQSAGVDGVMAFKGTTYFLAFIIITNLLQIGWSYLATRFTRYVLTTERLFTYKGVLTKRVDELELYRVKDYSQYNPFFLRLVGLGCVSVQTSDRSDPYVHLVGIKDPQVVQGEIRRYTEMCRSARGVREVDM